MDTAGMRQEILDVYSRQPQASFAVAFEDLSTGQRLLLNEHTSYHAASTMKTPVLIETFRQVAAHRLALTDSLLIHTDFISIADSSRYELDSLTDSERDLYRQAGKRLPLRELLYRMITQSSNLSTNLVIERVGAKNVLAAMRQLGAMDIQVLRGVEDEKAFQKGMNNTTTAYDLLLIFDRIALGKVVDSASCLAMIDILKAQHFKEVIAGKLPEGSGGGQQKRLDRWDRSRFGDHLFAGRPEICAGVVVERGGGLCGGGWDGSDGIADRLRSYGGKSRWRRIRW